MIHRSPPSSRLLLLGLLALSLTACAGEDCASGTKGCGGGTGPTDSGTTDTPTDSGTTGTGTTTGTTGTGTPTEPLVDLRFVPDDAAALSGTRLVLLATDPYFESVPEPGVSVAVGSEDGADRVVSFTPGEDQLIDESGNRVGKFVAMAWVDGNGDDAWQEGEELVSMPRCQLYYLADPASGQLAALGLEQGWNAIDLHLTDVYDVPALCDPLAIPISDNLRAAPETSMGGTSERPLEADERFAIQYTTEGPELQIDAGPATDPWSLAWSGEPDPAAQMEMIPGLYLSTGYPYVYTDADGSGTPNGRESYGMIPANDEGQEAIVSWCTAPTDPDTAHRLVVRLGLSQFGWGIAWVGEGGYVFLEPEDAASLVLTDLDH